MSLLVRARALLVAAAFTASACSPPAQCPPPAVAPATAAATAAPAASASAQTVKQVYRLDFVLTLTEVGKAPVVTEHTLNLQESMPGELRTGKNVPLTVGPPLGAQPPPPPSGRPGRPMPPGPPKPAGSGLAADAPPARPPQVSARQDVGFLLRSSFHQNGDTHLLRADTEMSNVDETGAVQKLVVRGEAPFVVGKQVLIASSEDPVTHRKLSLSATATAL